jgi:hypothetical protein
METCNAAVQAGMFASSVRLHFMTDGLHAVDQDDRSGSMTII